MRGYPIIFGEGVDPDAYQYFLRAGIASGTQTPTSYDNAASFNGTNQFLQTASNISFSSGESFSFAGWVNIANTTGRQNIVFVTTPSGDQWISLYGDATNSAYNFRCRNANTSVDVGVSVFVLPFPSNTYVFVHGQYDALLQKTAVSINNGAFTYSTATGAPISAISNPVVINGLGQVGATFFQGAISGLGFWKRALTASEVTQLWNNGAGRTYASLDSGLRTNLISWWALNQNSVTADSHGTNNLTNNGSVTAPNIGPIVTTTQNSRQLINNFVKGIKSLGLWNSMVCWPLRSSQNASTTLTARSLGGLGTFDGTLASSGALPVWTPDGVTFGANTQFINYTPNFNVDFTLGGYSVYAVWSAMGVPIISGELPFDLFSSIDAPFSLRNTITTGVGGGTTWLAQSRNYNGNRYYQNSGGQQPTSGNAAYGWNADTLTLQRDGADLSVMTAPSSTPTNGAYTMRTTGRNNSTTSATSRVSHLIAFPPSIGMTSQRMALIHSLYRQTLGLGLGLP